MLTYVALPYQMYRVTGSSLAVGLLGLAELVPLLATAFVGGALADAVDRRRMVLATDVGLAAGSGALTLLALLSLRRRAGRSIVAAAGCPRVGGLQRPSLEALDAAARREGTRLPAAAALAMFRGSIGMIAGPAIGGMLIAGRWPAAHLRGRRRCRTPCLSCASGRSRAVPPPEGAEPPSLRARARRLPLRAQPAGADRDLRGGLRRDGVRDAARAVPGPLRSAGRTVGARSALRRAGGAARSSRASPAAGCRASTGTVSR